MTATTRTEFSEYTLSDLRATAATIQGHITSGTWPGSACVNALTEMNAELLKRIDHLTATIEDMATAIDRQDGRVGS